MPKKPSVNWKNTDWSKRNLTLSKELNVSQGMVSRMRSRHAAHTKKWKWHGGVGTVDWKHADWSLSNKQLEKITGAGDVRYLRARFAPETIRRNLKRCFCEVGKRSCIMRNATCGFSKSGHCTFAP